MATGRSGQVDSPGGAMTQPPYTDNYAPGGFTGGTTPADTSTAAGPEAATMAPWRKPGNPVPLPFDGYSDVAHVGAGLAQALGENTRATTAKG